MLDDLDEVAVLQVDDVEPFGEVLDLLLKVADVGADDVRADQLGQVTLPGDERHDRDGPTAVRRLDQFDQSLHLVADEVLFAHFRLEPQHQFVEEENNSGVAEGLGVPRDDLEAVLQRHERTGLAALALGVGRHGAAEQGGDQLLPVRVVRRARCEGPVEVGAGPDPGGQRLRRSPVQHRHVVGVGLHGCGPGRGEGCRPLAEPLQEPGVVVEELPLRAGAGEHVGCRFDR